MKRFLLLFLLLPGLALAADRPGQRPRPTPPPPSPQNTEVYAIASDRTPLEWTVFTPSGKGPWPAVLVIHGGLYIGGSADDSGVVTCAKDLAAAGYIAFAINYRLAPPGSVPGQKSLGRFPDQGNDVHLAVLAARDDSRSNGRVGAVGGSAGATHAAWVAVTGVPGQDRIDAAVCLSGAYDLSDFSPDSELGIFIDTATNYVGVPVTNVTTLRAASPAWAVTSGVSPLFLVDSLGDLMPAVQLDDMIASLSAVKAKNYTAMSISGSLHSFGYWTQVKTDALAFLAPILK